MYPEAPVARIIEDMPVTRWANNDVSPDDMVIIIRPYQQGDCDWQDCQKEEIAPRQQV